MRARGLGGHEDISHNNPYPSSKWYFCVAPAFAFCVYLPASLDAAPLSGTMKRVVWLRVSETQLIQFDFCDKPAESSL